MNIKEKMQNDYPAIAIDCSAFCFYIYNSYVSACKKVHRMFSFFGRLQIINTVNINLMKDK